MTTGTWVADVVWFLIHSSFVTIRIDIVNPIAIGCFDVCKAVEFVVYSSFIFRRFAFTVNIHNNTITAVTTIVVLSR